jgi:hypothetical protein
VRASWPGHPRQPKKKKEKPGAYGPIMPCT